MKHKFIKLTQAKKEPLYINVSNILFFIKSVEYPDLSYIALNYNKAKSAFYVIETLEEIIKLIEEA